MNVRVCVCVCVCVIRIGRANGNVESRTSHPTTGTSCRTRFVLRRLTRKRLRALPHTHAHETYNMHHSTHTQHHTTQHMHMRTMIISLTPVPRVLTVACVCVCGVRER